MKNNRKKIVVALLSAFCILLQSGCAERQNEMLRADETLFAMNTYMTFTAYGGEAETVLDEVKKRVLQLESLWSVTQENSDIYRANHSDGQPVVVSKETAELISFALDMAEQTAGAMDPTIYPVLTTWGFTKDKKQVPSKQEIDQQLSLVDYSQISLSGHNLTVPAGMQLDLGAIGKGYAADLTVEILKENGVNHAIFSLGGNIHTVGSRPDGTDWRVGIRAPWEEGYLGILEVSDAAVVTSGGYENYFEDESGDIYWHILDPATGFPANSGLQAVTVIGKEGRMCDALSTALFVMGAEQAEFYWREHEGFELILVTEDGNILITDGIAQQFELNDGRKETVQVISK